MIHDNTIKQEIQDEWDGVRSFQSGIQASLNLSRGIGSAGAPHRLRNIAHNLVFLFAFSVLEKALKQLRDENVFKENRNGLKALMRSSKTILPWKDFFLIDKARCQRNKVAHDQKILERSDCWKYIDGIESELVTWNVVSKPKQFNH